MFNSFVIIHSTKTADKFQYRIIEPPRGPGPSQSPMRLADYQPAWAKGLDIVVGKGPEEQQGPP